MKVLKVSYGDVGEGEVAVNCEKKTFFPEQPVCDMQFSSTPPHQFLRPLAELPGLGTRLSELEDEAAVLFKVTGTRLQTHFFYLECLVPNVSGQ